MNIDEYLVHSIKNPKQIGGIVLVYNGAGKLVKTYNTIDLGKAYFNMSNDSFYNLYGFNFVPSGMWWEQSKRAAGKM